MIKLGTMDWQGEQRGTCPGEEPAVHRHRRRTKWARCRGYQGNEFGLSGIAFCQK